MERDVYFGDITYIVVGVESDRSVPGTRIDSDDAGRDAMCKMRLALFAALSMSS